MSPDRQRVRSKGAGSKRSRRDPDSLVIDLLVNLAATGLASLLVKVGRALFGGRRIMGPAPTLGPDTLGQLEARITELEDLLNRASSLIIPSGRRELGGMLLLDAQKIREYHKIREELLRQVVSLDDLTEAIFTDYEPGLADSAQERRFPEQFKAQVKFLEKHLRDARVASVAEEAFLEMTAAIGALRRVLQQIRTHISVRSGSQQ